MSTILALDIGTEFVKAVMAKANKKGELEVLGVGRARQTGSSMYAGAIADIPAVVNSCEKALARAENEAHETAHLAVVGIAGDLIQGNTTTVRYHRKDSNSAITEEEMENIITKVQEKSGAVAKQNIAIETGNEDTEIRLINSAIVSLTIDGYKISNPIGFKGSEIIIQFYTAFAPLIHVAAIEKVCAELNLELLTIAVEPFAVCRACLGNNFDSNYAGIVMDIGGGTTDIAIINDGGVEGTKMFSIGGRSFTHQIAESLGVDQTTAEQYKLAYDTAELDDHVKARVETAISRNLSVWLTGVQVAIEEFEYAGTLPRNIMLCGGGASLTPLQEQLALSDWYQNLPFSRRPIIHLIDITELPDFTFKIKTKINHTYATALGLLRVGVDTLASSPENDGLRGKIAKLLQK